MKSCGMFSVKLLSFALAVILLAGCSSNPSIPADTRTRMRSVAVISMLGDEIHWKLIGTTILTNKDSYYPVSWNIDEVIRNSIVEKLTQSGHECLAVKASLDKFYGSTIEYDSQYRAYEPFKLDRVTPQLSAVLKARQVDAFILVTRRMESEIQSGLPLYGYCVYKRSFLGLPAYVKLSTAASLVVVDVRTLSVTEKRFHLLQDIERGLWKDDFTQISESENKQIESILKNNLKNKVLEAMSEVGI